MLNQASYWEKRSKKYNSEIEGVLFKSFPRPLNEYLHSWMSRELAKEILANKKTKVLDMGCGYGRLSKYLLDSFPNVTTTGIDISKHFVNLYNKELNPRGKAIVGSITNLPFANNSFDFVVMAVSMVCLEGSQAKKKAIQELFRVLKPNGKFLIIESNKTGYLIVSCGGILGGVGKGKEGPVPAMDVTPKFLRSEIEKNNGEIRSIEGIPFWTITMPLSLALSMISPNLGRSWLRIVTNIDKHIKKLVFPSLYISYRGIKK